MLRSRRLPWVLIGVTLAILAGTILFATLQLRAKIREQIAGRDGEVLDAVAFEHLAADLPEIELLGPLTDPDNQLSVVLKTSRLKGVVATRLVVPSPLRNTKVSIGFLARLNSETNMFSKRWPAPAGC